MTFFPQYDSHQKIITMAVIRDLLCKENLIPGDAYLNSVDINCYCEDDYRCCCTPESLTYTWVIMKPNCCETCGATGGEQCKTKGGKKTGYHKARKLL